MLVIIQIYTLYGSSVGNYTDHTLYTFDTLSSAMFMFVLHNRTIMCNYLCLRTLMQPPHQMLKLCLKESAILENMYMEILVIVQLVLEHPTNV